MTFNSALEQEKAEENQLAGISFSFFLRPRTGFRWGVAIAILAAGIAQLHAPRLFTARVSAQNSKRVDVVVRACKNIAISSKPSKGANKNGKKKLEDAGANPAGACLEIRSTALEIQEYLQTYGREQKWNLSDEHVAEDAWTFSRKLERDELLRYTKNDADTDRVKWTSGVALVQVQTMELDEGFVRVQVSAHFQGYGESADRFAPPKEFWPMSSNATLENHLIAAVKRHYKNAP